MKAFISFGFIITFASCLFASDPNTSQSSENDSEMLGSVLFWNIQIPDDVEKNEAYGMIWHGDVDKRERETGLVFENIKAGTQIKVFLDVKAFSNGESINKIRFSFKYNDAQGTVITRSGNLSIPEGYDDLFGHMRCGELTDDAWLLMLQGGRARSTDAKSCYLNLGYVATNQQCLFFWFAV